MSDYRVRDVAALVAAGDRLLVIAHTEMDRALGGALAELRAAGTASGTVPGDAVEQLHMVIGWLEGAGSPVIAAAMRAVLLELVPVDGAPKLKAVPRMPRREPWTTE